MCTTISRLGDGIDAGGKANALGKLIANQIPVPQGLIIPFQTLTDLLVRSGKEQEFFHAVKGEFVLYRSSLVTNILEALMMDETVEELVTAICGMLSGKVIVRSSADNEDTMTSSMAGVYESVVVQSNPTDLWRGILECWLAAFSNRVFNMMGAYPESIHLIVQEFIDFDQSGIAFSAFQDKPDAEECMRIEMVEGDCAQLVDGLIDPVVYQFQREKEPRADHRVHQATLSSLKAAMLDLEKIMGCPVDMEWGVRQGKLSITQCRPITQKFEQIQVEHASWWEEEQIHSLLSLQHQPCKETMEQHIRKKYWTRLVLKRHHIRIAAMGFFCYQAARLTEEHIESIRLHCRTKLIEIRTDNGFLRIPNETEQILQKLKEHPFAQEDAVSIVCILEFPLAEKSGYSKLAGERFIIEAIRGGFNSLWKDGTTPSRYEIAQDGQQISVERNTATFYYVYDLNALRWTRRELQQAETCELTSAEIEQIVHLTQTLESKIGNVSVEWTASSAEGGVTFFDLSKENNDLFSAEGNILSNGSCQSTIRRLSADALDSLFETIHEVNIIPTEDYLKKTNSSDFQEAVLQLVGYGQPIVVTEFPKRSLAPLIPYVSGFLFQKGAALCHLSILLREAGIPAVISSDMYAALVEGEEVMITGQSILQVKGSCRNEPVKL